MKMIFSLLLLYSEVIAAQQSFVARIVDEDTHRALAGVTVSIEKLNESSINGDNGIIYIQDLQAGRYTIHFSCIGYKTKASVFSIPLISKDTLEIGLEPSQEALPEVFISSTRLNQTIKNTPVHIDHIGHEDIEEGTAMSPGNIRELLTELSGTQVQQTSAVSGNVNIRLLGLDGRYTQLLKDGFPLYGGFSGGLSIMQTPPLDLKQVEVIKGAGSALYGGDAIAGIINLISKTPDTLLHADAILNQTIKGGTDLSGFYSHRNRATGITLLATASHQKPFDVNKDGFTDLPRVRQVTIAPNFFLYPGDSSILRAGFNISSELRTGGDLYAIVHGADSLHPFLEESHTDRNYYQLSYEKHWRNGSSLSCKNSFGWFKRSLLTAANSFSGGQFSSFTEISYQLQHTVHQDVIGFNIVTDHFRSDGNQQSLGYKHNTIGIFAQDDWKINKRTTLETGIRTDFNKRIYLLPRVAILHKISPSFVLRAGGGMAYKLPTIFNALTEEEGYQKIYPLSSNTRAERSMSANLAVNYHGYIGDDIHVTIDQNFYYLRLTNALIAQEDSLASGWIFYENAPGPVHSGGFETNAIFSLANWMLTFSYTYTDARRFFKSGNMQLPLTPKNRFNVALLYESEDNFRAGIEAFFTGRQYLEDGTKARSFRTFDAMVEKQFGHFSILLNFENFTDTRQSRFGPLYTGSIQKPVFKEIYAPAEGIVGNLALRFRL